MNNPSCWTLTRLAAAASIAFLPLAVAQADEAPAAPSAEVAEKAQAGSDTPVNLDAVVVTASPTGGSKMKSSVSVSTLSGEQVQNSGANSVTEVLRAIPGIHSESSGGDSNANLSVRGVPISAGGSRYVQYQEDGLPVLQFGDIAFATPDSFVRTDSYLGRLEVIRGGSASTLATSAPGGIVNLIGNTGETAGGSIGFGYGLKADEQRSDFSYGGPLADKTRFFVAGHYRSGGGTRDPGVDVVKGGQLRANLTHEFANGFVRINLKHLNENAPTLLPVPVRYDANGNISQIPGIDPRTASFYSPYLLPDVTLGSDNSRKVTDINDGFTAQTNALGLEGEYRFAGGWKLSNKFRSARNRGHFIGIFPGDEVRNVSTTYASGPQKGQAYNGPAFTAVVFNTSLDNFDLMANDLKLSNSFELGVAGTLSTAAGLYTSKQNLGITWNFNQYLLEAKGNKAAVLSSPSNGSNAFGGCCSNTQDSTYTTMAPYLVAGWELGPVNLDASVRADNQKARGSYNQLLFAASGSTTYDPSKARRINYTVRHTSYSLGGNYRLTKDLALFGRYSDGVAFNADRITFFNAAALVDGRSPVPSNSLKQVEAGVKYRTGGLNTFVTYFHAKTAESNFDVTTQRGSANTYSANGLETEVGYRIGSFRVTGGLTYTDSTIKVSNDPTLVGTTPNRLAKFIYQVSPTYSIGKLNLGGSIVGTTEAKDNGTAGKNTVTLPGYAVVNGFANYEVFRNVEVSLGVNNLLDKLGYTESNDGRAAARSIDGRTGRVGVKYQF